MLKVDGTVWTLGIGENGELGTGEAGTKDEPVQVKFPEGTKIIQVACGENHCLALDNTGNVWSWGDNQYYGLGNTKVGTQSTPAKISELSEITKIACGNNTSFALTKQGDVYSFGYNANGECGIGSYTNQITVTKAKNISNVIDIKAGKNYCLALKNTGEICGTGSNLYGELGIGNTNIRRQKEFTKLPNIDNAVMIGTGDGHSMYLNTLGEVYTWGSNIYKELGVNNTGAIVQTPTKVENLSNIRYIDGGKNTSTAIDKQGQVYVCGLNQHGELGLGDKSDRSSFEIITSINEIVQISSGNTYTLMVRKDGTVWGTGDYAHGDEEVKSKTKGTSPIQVGKDETTLSETEITIKVGEQKDIISDCSYAFNLIYLDQNFKDSLEYSSLRMDIAGVSDKGVVLGVKVGTTRINAVSNVNGKIYTVLVKVVPETANVAPKVEAGENFAGVLKADGSIWTFGYNGDGRLGTGNYKTQDIPTKTDVISTYTDIKTGKDFIIALRSDGTVWGAGNNKSGQLGSGVAQNSNKLTQIKDLKDIVKISAGKDFVQAMDRYGIVYQIGGGYKTPVEVQKINGTIIDISCGEEQSVYVTSSGKVYGYGNMLNGEMPNIENAVKTACVEGKIIILNTLGESYEYTNGTLSKINIPERVIDLNASKNTVMYQTVNETTYIGENKVTVHGENTFGIGAGENNTYIIENTGNVYSAGDNTYGSIGNGTRDNSIEHTVVGDRAMKIEPENKAMKIGDTEELEIKLLQFNVFTDKDINTKDFTIESDEPNIVSVDTNGRLEALSTGTAHITITDKITNRQLVLKRVVERELTDDISIIKITAESKEKDGSIEEIEAKLVDNSKMMYQVEVQEWTDISKVKVTLNEPLSELSIDGNAYVNAQDEKYITLDEDIEEIKIIVKSEKGTEAEYTLVIRKVEWIPPEINIVEIYAKDGDDIYKTTKIDEENYEVKVPGHLTEVDVTAITEYVKDKVQVGNTGIYIQNKDTQKISLPDRETTVNIKVQSEDNTLEKECTLKIIKMSQNANLEKVEVDGIEVQLKEDGKYHFVMTNAKAVVNVKAYTEEKAPCEAWVNIENSAYDLYETEKTINIIARQTEVKIKVKAEEGNTKTYTLVIEGLPDDTSIKEVVINGVKATYLDGKNRYELRSKDTHFEITVTLNDLLASMELGGNAEAIGIDLVEVDKQGEETLVKVKVISQSKLETEEYTIAIVEKSSNNKLDIVKVNEEIVSQDENGKYKIGVKNSTKELNIEAIAEDTYATTYIDNSTNNSYIAKTSESVVAGKTIYTYELKVIAENGEEAIYELEVEILESNYNIIKVECGETADVLEEAVLKEDGNYYYRISDVDKANVKVTLESEKSKVKIKDTLKDNAEVELEGNTTKVPITVIGEDGTEKQVFLIIEKKSNDTTIKSITGNEVIKADIAEDLCTVYVEEEAESATLTITLNNEFAWIKLSEEEEYTLKEITTTIDLSDYYINGGATFVAYIKAEDGTEVERIISIEKQEEIGIKSVIINNETIDYNEQKEKYEAIVPNANKPQIVITANNTKQTIQLLDKEGNIIASGTGTLTTTQNLSEAELINNYVIKVISSHGEDFGNEEYDLSITQKSKETGIIYVKVDNLGTMVSDDGLKYSTQVAGKETYPVEIKLKDEKAKVRIEDLEGNILINDQLGILIGNLAVQDGEIKELKIVVTAENENEQEYTLEIERISSNIYIESITVTDYDETKENIVTKDVVEYDSNTKTYTVVVDSELRETTVTVKTESSSTAITLDSTDTQNGISNVVRNLTGFGTETVKIKLVSPDGSEETRYLKIVQKPNSTYISGRILTENVNGEYISTVSIYKIIEEQIEDEEGNIETVITKELYKQEETTTDGNFQIQMYTQGIDEDEVLEGKYELVVTKQGYLTYTVENIQIEENINYDIREYNLIAGDITGDGEIGLEDLVSINDHYGSTLLEGYDLNEDGKVDLLDRTILKQNYTKKAETKLWTDIIKQ